MARSFAPYGGVRAGNAPPDRPRSPPRITLFAAEWSGAAIPAAPAFHIMESAMTHSSTEVIKKKLLADFNAVMSEADELLKLVADEGGDKAGALRTKVEHNLNAAKRQP